MCIQGPTQNPVQSVRILLLGSESTKAFNPRKSSYDIRSNWVSRSWPWRLLTSRIWLPCRLVEHYQHMHLAWICSNRYIQHFPLNNCHIRPDYRLLHSSRMQRSVKVCKIWGCYGGDYEESRLLRYKIPFVPHRRHITSPIQIQAR
jgi:hypothetical protein